jgi:hypothetical protein
MRVGAAGQYQYAQINACIVPASPPLLRRRRAYLLDKNASKLPRFDRFGWFAIDYTGRFWIDNPGQYRFSLLSDDSARMGIDGRELIDHDGIHAASALSASAFLSRGAHTLRISYFQKPRFTVALVQAVAAPASAWRIVNTDHSQSAPRNRPGAAWATSQKGLRGATAGTSAGPALGSQVNAARDRPSQADLSGREFGQTSSMPFLRRWPRLGSSTGRRLLASLDW